MRFRVTCFGQIQIAIRICCNYDVIYCLGKYDNIRNAGCMSLFSVYILAYKQVAMAWTIIANNYYYIKIN